MFEIHITVSTDDAPKAKQLADLTVKWKTSEIARDPLLGNATYFYLTFNGYKLFEVITAMSHMVQTLENFGVRVLRKKIENIIYDSGRLSGFIGGGTKSQDECSEATDGGG